MSNEPIPEWLKSQDHLLPYALTNEKQLEAVPETLASMVTLLLEEKRLTSNVMESLDDRLRVEQGAKKDLVEKLDVAVVGRSNSELRNIGYRHQIERFESTVRALEEERSILVRAAKADGDTIAALRTRATTSANFVAKLNRKIKRLEAKKKAK